MDLFSKAAKLKKDNRSFVIVTVVSASGSSPGKSGFKLLYQDDGKTAGTVGGGEIEATAIRHCQSCLASKRNDLVEYLLAKDGAPSDPSVVVVPMNCSGRMKLYYETHNSHPTIYIFGGGHVGHALLYFLKPLPYNTVLIDNREQFASREQNPAADQIVHSDYLEYTQSFNPAPGSLAVLLTHGHEYDYDVSRIIFSRSLNLKYVGIIASKNKSASIRKKLLKNVPDESALDILHSPIGLKIGGNTADEIALSIAAEIQSLSEAK